MHLKLRSMDADSQHQKKPVYHQPQSSSTFSFFTERSIPGFRNESFGGDRVEIDAFRGRIEMRESIRRELEKERIREEIIAEEMARKRVLEVEVRNELMMEHEMALRSGGGGVISSKFMPLSMLQSHTDLFDRNVLHRQSMEEKLVMSIDEKYRRGGHLREIRGFPMASVQLLGDSPKIKGIKKEVVDLSKPSDETRSVTKRKSAPQVSEGSSEHGSDGSKKKIKGEWICAVCQVSATSERGLNEHLRGKKHHAKEAALASQKSGANFGLGVAPKNAVIKQVNLALTTGNMSTSEEKESETRKESVNKTLETSNPNEMKKKEEKDKMVGENKGDRFKFWCEMCKVGAFTETVMNAHKEGKKHSSRLVELYRKSKVDSEASATENTCETKHNSDTNMNQTLIVQTLAIEVEPVKDDIVEAVKDDIVEVVTEVEPVKDDIVEAVKDGIVEVVKDDIVELVTEVEPVKDDIVEVVKDDTAEVIAEEK